MSRIVYRSKQAGFTSLTPGACQTQGWQSELVWSPKIRRLYDTSWPQRAAIDELLSRHSRALPELLRAGQEVTSSLEDEGERLFSDTVFLMTSCGSHPAWESPRRSRCRISSLIAYPSSF
jgi:hypothetical protein